MTNSEKKEKCCFKIYDIIHEYEYSPPDGVFLFENYKDEESRVQYFKQHKFIKCKIREMIFEGYTFVEKYPEKLPETWTCDNAKEKLVEKEKEKCFGI